LYIPFTRREFSVFRNAFFSWEIMMTGLVAVSKRDNVTTG